MKSTTTHFTVTSRPRNVCLTSYEDTPWQYDPTVMRYLVYQREMCPTTKKLHWQGYAEFYKALRFNALKKLLGPTTCIFPRRGSRDQARQYCMKDDTYVSDRTEFGVWTNEQGKRNDLEEIKTKLQGGSKIYDIATEHFGTWCRYHKAIARYKVMAARQSVPKWRKVEVYIYYGDTGSGKTKAVYDREEDIFKLPMGDQQQLWFDGYEGEDVLLLDEFYGQIKFNFFLQLLDGYPLRLPVKGGHSYAAWTKVYITGQYSNDNWYLSIDQKLREHINRRITKKKRFGEEELYPMFNTNGRVNGVATTSTLYRPK